MNANIEELQGRLAAAEERVKKITRLMLRSVWQYVIQHRSPLAAPQTTLNMDAGDAKGLKTIVSHQQNRRSGKKVTQEKKSNNRVVDQARLSRELYRTAFGAARQEIEDEIITVDLKKENESDGVPSVALLLLQSSRERAIMHVFLLRLRLTVCRRRFLDTECKIRYDYYRLRRTLRAWHSYTCEVACRRRRIIYTVLNHWMGLVECRRVRYERLCRFRLGLAERRRAFDRVRWMRMRRCFVHWRHRLDDRRLWGGPTTDGALSREGEKRATEKQKERRLRFLFAYWRRRVERRLDTRLAALIATRSLLRRSWEKLCRRSRARVLGPREPPCVHVESTSMELVGFKVQCAQQVARGNLKRCVFVKWRRCYRCRVADRFYIFSRRVRVLETWLQALRRKRVAQVVLGACWCRWRQRYHQRLHYIEAQYWRHRRLLQSVLYTWTNKTASRIFRSQHLLQLCYHRWWQRAILQRTQRELSVGVKKRAFLAWRDVAVREKEYRTMMCLAETLRELVLLMGCFRRWKRRHEHAYRVRLSESVLNDLRREKQRAQLFQRWKRLTFWPRNTNKKIS
ncbi:uncharacterized protein TM35_000043010 [Trypanosoma theileri]|uniref:Sfi1 spindle body domain-containing protein n=1 Tax=Trypanosoma theileri TaxID=67003 RepID=A0A1X0P570_9TRYP|nr:uncharacterized protein TM35_000043010 [Trypanosoma theileri]ORC92087.1 hypothetical protein TM35_000043010 [Trypanosoma theileri]